MKIINIENINKLPNAPGVYMFWSNSELLYIGQSKNIKGRVQQHLREKENEQYHIKIKDIKMISWEKTCCEYSTHRKEYDLLKILKTKFNAQSGESERMPHVLTDKEIEENNFVKDELLGYA